MPEDDLTDKEVLMAAVLIACVPKCRWSEVYNGLMRQEPNAQEIAAMERKGLTVEGVRKAARVAFGYAS